MPLSFREIEELIRPQLPKPAEGYVWIADTFADKVVYVSEPKNGQTKRYEVPYMIDNGAVKLGTSIEVVRRTVYEPIKATFTATNFSDAGDGYVEWEGPIWEAGDYPDKKVKADENAIASLVKSFNTEGYGVNFGHTDDNVLTHTKAANGELVPLPPKENKVGYVASVRGEGKTLFGKVRFKKWFCEEVGGEVACSAELYPDPYEFAGLGITLKPRVSKARLVAAFSASEEAPKPMNDTLTKEDVGFIQKLKALFSGGGGASEHPTATENTQLRAELDQVKAELAKFSTEQGSKTEADRIRANAVAFADGLISTNKAIPSERDFIVSQFEAAARSQVVVFSDAGALNESPALKELKSYFEGRTPHFFTQAVVPNTSHGDAGAKIDTGAIYANLNKRGGN